jgi:hypothetical protein
VTITGRADWTQARMLERRAVRPSSSGWQKASTSLNSPNAS